MPQHITSHDRFLGCLAGLAVGDAVGTSLEFQPPGGFDPLTDMVGGGPFGLEPGQWTDDTSMALCLAESLVATGGFDPRDQMERYLRWYREGYWSSTRRCFDIGNTVRTALRRFEATGEPFAGSSDPRSAGNGSLMRLAPVVLFAAHDPARALHLAGESSRTTHGARAAIDACRFFAGLLVGALRGESKETLLSAGYCPLPGYWAVNPLDPDIAEIANGSFKTRQPPEIRGTGYVVRSLEAALWAFYHGRDFREGCLLAANLGDDADTTAAIYGQLAGAFYGLPGIPAAWLAKLARREEILELAQQLAEFGLRGTNYDDQTPA
jgi:ADP-ribosyl-[dinitrogen reductase] hydrolase